MKIALCYHGIAKGTNYKDGGLPVGFNAEFELLTKHLIDQNKEHQFDVFLHSWSKEHEQEVVSKMKPVSYLFEDPRVFKKPTPFLMAKETIKRLFGKGYEYKRLNNIYSRWYSFFKVCELVKMHDVEYDMVFVTRFDMCLLNPLTLNEISKDKFYSGDWNFFLDDKKNEIEEPYIKEWDMGEVTIVPKGYPFDDEGLQDFFFIGSSDYMLNSFSNIFFELSNLTKKYGSSNHFIALGKLKEDGAEHTHARVLKYYKDYFLSRWLW